VAPSTSPSLTIPLVFALAGNATWFVYLLAMIAIVLVGFCVSRFARLSASPGSLYTYTAATLPPVFGVTVGWALLLAYLATGASVAGGAMYYAFLLARQFSHWTPPSLLVLALVCGTAGYIAYRDIKLSAELMLWIEVVSVSLMLVVLLALVYRHGLQIDRDQFALRGVHVSSLGPALLLAIFSFVGFESSTTLGVEARNPLRTIPRAILQCAFIVGAFLMLCAYSEVLGFRGISVKLSETASPLHILTGRAGISPLGVAIDIGAFVSMFACVLACTTAAARVLMRMARSRLLPSVFERAAPTHGTPTAAVALCAGTVFATARGMAIRSFAGSEIYDLCGSLSVFGFLTAYALVAGPLPFARASRGQHSHAVAAASMVTVLVLILIAIFDLRSSTESGPCARPLSLSWLHRHRPVCLSVPPQAGRGGYRLTYSSPSL
jgi:amino acid transporter